jgi:5-methylcytosine-specific restriction endonuclease McrA
MEHTTISPPICAKHGCEKVWGICRSNPSGGRWLCKKCKKESNRAWAKANPEKRKANIRAWRDANPEKVKASNRAWDKANPEKRKAMISAWSKENPEKIRGYSRAWREANPEKRKTVAREWGKRNPEKRLANVHHREARKRAAASPLCKVTAAAIAERFALTKGCAYCGAEEKLTLDHVVALNDGGLHVPSNLVGACGRCNSSKNDSPVEAWFKAQPFFSEQRWQRIQQITGQGQLSLI